MKTLFLLTFLISAFIMNAQSIDRAGKLPKIDSVVVKLKDWEQTRLVELDNQLKDLNLSVWKNRELQSVAKECWFWIYKSREIDPDQVVRVTPGNGVGELVITFNKK